MVPGFNDISTLLNKEAPLEATAFIPRISKFLGIEALESDDILRSLNALTRLLRLCSESASDAEIVPISVLSLEPYALSCCPRYRGDQPYLTNKERTKNTQKTPHSIWKATGTGTQVLSISMRA
jgi:hypothetical protein